MTVKMTKETGVAAALLAVMVLATVVAVILPQNRRIREIRTDIAGCKAALAADSEDAASVPRLARQVQTLQNRYSGFDRQMPASHELFDFLKQIGESLQHAKLSSRSIKPGAPAQEGLFHALPIIVQCQGAYADLSAFLAEVDRMERLTRVKRIELRRRPRSQDLDIVVHMNIYFTQN